jgi:hypothetical protein
MLCSTDSLRLVTYCSCHTLGLSGQLWPVTPNLLWTLDTGPPLIRLMPFPLRAMGMAAKAIPFRVTRGVSCKQKADVLSVNVELRHAKRRAVASLSLLARQGLFFKVVCLRLPKGRLHPMRDAQSVAKTWVPGYWSTSSHLSEGGCRCREPIPST